MDALPKELALLIIGVVLGALASGIVQWKISHDEEDVELRNVAQALYIDISSVEETYNYSLNHTSIDKNHITVNNVHYYDDNGLYFIFNKDISKFDSETSKDLYDFYSFVLDVENKQEELLAINEKLLRKENLTDSFAITDVIDTEIASTLIKQDLADNFDIIDAGTVQTVVKTIADAFNLVDSVARQIGINVVDTMNLADSIAKVCGIPLTDALTILDLGPVKTAVKSFSPSE